MNNRISDERLKELAQLWDGGGQPQITWALRELLALRASHAELMTVLDGLMNLFRDPSPFYIKKLGSPITNGDQDKIDDAFLTADNVLLAAKKVTA